MMRTMQMPPNGESECPTFAHPTAYHFLPFFLPMKTSNKPCLFRKMDKILGRNQVTEFVNNCSLDALSYSFCVAS
jgi:hypothetical protein